MKKFWIGRHGFAGDGSDDPKIERERPLKPQGIAIVKAMAKAMIDLGETPKVIFASPLARAQQTADIYGKILGVQVSIIDDLSPNRPMDDRVLELLAHGEIRSLMLIGHHDNTTPAFNNFGGSMGKWTAKDDDDLRDQLGYASGSGPSFKNDGTDDGKKGDWVPLVMAEVRRVRINRDTGKWKCKFRLRPSDIGLKDY